MLPRSFALATAKLYSTLHLTLPTKPQPQLRIYSSHPATIYALETYTHGIDQDYLRNFYDTCGTSDSWDEVYGKPYGKLYMLSFDHRARGIVAMMLLEGKTDFLKAVDDFKLLYGIYRLVPYLLPSNILYIHPETFPFNFGLISNITRTPIHPITYQRCLKNYLSIAIDNSKIVLSKKDHRFSKYLNSLDDIKKEDSCTFIVRRIKKKRRFFGT